MVEEINLTGNPLQRLVASTKRNQPHLLRSRESQARGKRKMSLGEVPEVTEVL